MTTMPTRDELQRLSDAAKQGTWASKNANVLAADGRAVVVACDWDDLAEWQANVALIVALVNAYRAGELVAAEPGVAVPEPDEQQRGVIACKHCDRIIPEDDCCMAGPAASPVAQEDQP